MPTVRYVCVSNDERLHVSPTLIAYGALGLAIVSEVSGSSLLGKTDQFSRLIPTLGVVVCFAASLFFLSHALRVLPLGMAYAIWAGLGIVLTALVGWIVLRQPLDAAAMVGIAMIVGGVVIMRLFSTAAGH